MKNEIKTEVKKLVKEVFVWCIDNHVESFMCDCHLTAHVSWIEVKLMSGGYGSGGDVFSPDYVSLDNEKWSVKWLEYLLKEMKDFKLHHDEEFKPENLAKKQKAKDEAKLKSLKKQLSALELKMN